MTRAAAVIVSTLPLAAVLVTTSGLGPALLAQSVRPSQAVVTRDDPIWAGAQDSQEPQEPPTPPNGDQEPVGGRGRGGAGQPPQPRPYAQVITSEARTDAGIFTVVFLRLVDYSLVADASTPIARAVDAANTPAIVRVFNVAAFNPSGDPVIEVTPLFLTEVPELSVRGRIGARGFDQSRTFLERVVSFPENVNVEVTQTYTAPIDAGGGRGEQPAPGRVTMRGNSSTVVMSYSMVKLPEHPMMPRLFDERVGYFTRSLYDYSRTEHEATERTYITRYRLENSDPSAEISEPVKPIVYHVDPATPAAWVPYVKKGIEDWQPAFEAAGFRNAIVARDAPAPMDDPDWSPEDARYSVVRWLPSTTQNAFGPHIHDPRTGEILEADVQLHHNIQDLLKNWYFVQVGALDPRARRLPLPDSLMGELIRYAVAHEVGHTLGFQHNMKASAMYSQQQVRDRTWVRQNGHTPTLMDYARFNYVAQPEDGLDVADLIPKIGPYDRWATMWGYKPIAGARTPDGERATLDPWARQQDQTPWYRFSTAQAGASDPFNLTEAVGDADAVQATTLGLKNLARVAAMLLDATTTKPGEPYRELTEVYGRLVGQWTLEMNHVASLVGDNSLISNLVASVIGAFWYFATLTEIPICQALGKLGMAIENARDVYTRRQEGQSIWVVPASAISASQPEDAAMLFDPADDKTYRHPTFYTMPEGAKYI